MDDTRHAVVESPDGTVAIAFNEEVPPPPPPPPPLEIIRPRPRFRFSIEYHPVVRGLAYIFVISAGINLAHSNSFTSGKPSFNSHRIATFFYLMQDRKERIYGCGMAVKSLQSTPFSRNRLSLRRKTTWQ